MHCTTFLRKEYIIEVLFCRGKKPGTWHKMQPSWVVYSGLYSMEAGPLLKKIVIHRKKTWFFSWLIFHSPLLDGCCQCTYNTLGEFCTTARIDIPVSRTRFYKVLLLLLWQTFLIILAFGNWIWHDLNSANGRLSSWAICAYRPISGFLNSLSASSDVEYFVNY